MLTRRSFLKNTAIAAAAAPLISPADLMMPVPRHIGVQLWSVRDDMNKDPKGTVEALAKMGYREVEAFGFDAGKLFGLTYADFKALLKSNGMTMPSTHSMFTLESFNESTGEITDKAKKIIDDAAAFGSSYIIAPWMKEEDRAKIGSMVKALDAAGAYAKKAGIRFGYHNHNFEFEQKGPDGRRLYEWIIQETDAKNVALEMDLYWVVKAGFNPLDWIRLYPGRFELCHAKDMANTPKADSVEVGDGTIDFKSIFRQSAAAGLKYYIVELEAYVTTPMEGVDRARKGLVKMF